MTIAQSLWAFTFAAAVLAMTPGVDTALVLRTSVAGGVARAVLAALGVAAGCVVWGAVVAVGLGALLATSGLLFSAVKLAGAAYLVWMGTTLLFARRGGLQLEPGVATEDGEGWLAAFLRGFLTNVLNPKVGVFYLTFLPQFVPAGVDVAGFSFLLALIHVLLSFVWFALMIALALQVRAWLARPAVVRWLDRLTGLFFVGFGLRLAVSEPA
ncbi:LysE family translocator [Thauera humireducens]|uniref:LysE family translocator n=1 Tax=Thauera humireducens TaxID=1134435 RepID=UPI00311D749E